MYDRTGCIFYTFMYIYVKLHNRISKQWSGNDQALHLYNDVELYKCVHMRLSTVTCLGLDIASSSNFYLFIRKGQ